MFVLTNARLIPELTEGFDGAMADVVVNAAELSDANRAQIEDIVTRKTGVAAENVVITPVNAQGEEAK